MNFLKLPLITTLTIISGSIVMFLGVAHEINTPLGIGVTAISTLPDIVTQLKEMFLHEEVDEDELNNALDYIHQGAMLGLANMCRAAELVARFKRTSVDQSSECERSFNIMKTLKDVVLSLHNIFKTSQIAIHIDGPEDLVVFSHPGAMGQIFTNLLQNSFKHGFENGKQNGTINIRFSITAEPTHLHFWYQDNGRGIEEVHMKKLFEPFFTTARESGGSGLGTYIIYNIITNQFNGEINASSVLGQGVEFTFNFPVQRKGSPS